LFSRRPTVSGKRWPERVGAKFAAGTLERIAAVLAEGEERRRSSAKSSDVKAPGLSSEAHK
jgi:hypothetical protein